jgi:predicted GIY-YIG superfamily endonuclease
MPGGFIQPKNDLAGPLIHGYVSRPKVFPGSEGRRRSFQSRFGKSERGDRKKAEFMAWAYILRGASGRHYVGATENLDRRLLEHRRGNVHSTARLGGSIILAASKQLGCMTDALVLERSLKRKKNPALAIYILSR